MIYDKITEIIIRASRAVVMMGAPDVGRVYIQATYAEVCKAKALIEELADDLQMDLHEEVGEFQDNSGL